MSVEERKSFYIKYGLIIGLILAIISFLASSNLQNEAIVYSSYFVFIVGVIITIYMYASSSKSEVTFGELFIVGLKTGSVIIIIMLLTGILMNYIFPDMKENVIAQAKQKMIEQKTPQASMDKAVELTKNYYIVFLIGGTIFGGLINTIVGSVIGALIPKKSKNKIS